MTLTNRHWFSYPGYAEILLGEAHDDTIKSNDPIRNPYTTVLEVIRERLTLPRERVATFASWGVFNAIAEHTEGATCVESQPDYRGKTHVLITTDHGRGDTTADWRDHGAKIPGAEFTWIAFASPTMTARGPWTKHAPLTTNQIAATVARWMGVDWKAARPQAGKAIQK